MNKTFQLSILFLGALALSFTLANASEGKCGESKSSDDKKEMKCAAGKCNSDTNKTKKKVPTKGKCGQGKCG